jgi:hypothetical protein
LEENWEFFSVFFDAHDGACAARCGLKPQDAGTGEEIEERIP